LKGKLKKFINKKLGGWLKIKNITILIGIIAIAIIITLIAYSTFETIPGITNNNEKIDIPTISKFIGKWETEASIADENILQIFTFYENNTLLSEYIIFSTGETHRGWADYNIDNETICMKTHPHGAITDGDSFCYTYTFSNDNTHMTLANNELPTERLVKVQ